MSTYTNLKIELLNVGDTGWGPTTNNNFQYALEEAVISSADVAFASADVTLTLTNSNLTQTARNLRLVCTGTTGGTARNLILGSNCQFKKPFIILNSCADAITVKNTTGTGISVPAGKTMWVYNESTSSVPGNVVDAITHVSSLTIANLSGDVVGTTATQTLTNKTIAYSSNTLTDVVGTTAAQTLTNKTIAYSSNTLTDVAGTTATQTLTNKTLTNPTVNDYTEGVVAATITGSGAACTLLLTNGTVQTATLTALTACTFTMPTATAGKSFILLLKQAATTGNGTATFTSVKFNSFGAPVITATAGKMDILTFVADGTNWYGTYSQGYTP